MQLDGHRYYLHRLAWYYVYGQWPERDVDHINGDPSDNRITNLRLATQTQNNANARRRRDNTSGFKGVTWNRARRKWMAQIDYGGDHFYLGLFTKIEAARAVYAAKSLELFGEFARAE
jgi:hypothetical protein